MKDRFPILLAALGVAAIAAGAALRRATRMSFRGKVAVITGGSRGLGLALARELAKEGARTHLIARDIEELRRAAESLRDLRARTDLWPCDLRDPAQVKNVITDIATHEGRIDLLINNAGTILVAPFQALEPGDFAEAMELHFWAPLEAIRAALPMLKQARGRIVNIASIGGRVAVPHLAAYTASKFALAGLSEGLRCELREAGVRVTTVSPGLMRTGSHFHAGFKGDTRKEFAWFSLGATLPFLSIGAGRAARQILRAARAGKAELTITLQARIITALHALAPNLFARGLELAHHLLPRSTAAGPARAGSECTSWISPSFLTTLGDRAARRLNQHH